MCTVATLLLISSVVHLDSACRIITDIIVNVINAEVHVVNVGLLVNVATVGPIAWCLELIDRHVLLQGLGRAIVLPKLETALNMLEGLVPVAGDVALEGLAEDGVELHDVLLQTNDVTVQSEHVVDTLVFEVFNVNRLILLQLDKVTDLMFFGYRARLLIIERHIVSVDTHWFLNILQGRIDESIHCDDINLAERVTSLQTH